jgi:predicted RNA-binding protein with TRAM domain
VGGSRTQAFRVALNPRVLSIVVGPGAERLREIEAQTKRRFFLEPALDAPLDHFEVLAQGKLEEVRPAAPLDEGAELELKLVEVGLHDPQAGVGKVDGLDVCVAAAAKLVGKKVKIRVERVLDGTAYATWLDAPMTQEGPLTAEAEAEKPTRQPRTAKKAESAAEEAPEAIAADAEEAEEPEEPEEAAEAEETGAEPKKRTRRGSRGGRGRKKKPAAGAQAGAEAQVAAGDQAEPAEPETEAQGPRIHLPSDDLGRDEETVQEAPAAETVQEEAPAEEKQEQAAGEGEPAPAKKRTRRGTRGGRGRKRTPAAAAAEATADEPSDDGKPAATEWDYVPMSEWEDEVRA